MNYTKDQTEYMIEKYKTNPSRDTVEELADEFSKSVKSVIGKLSREVYIDARSTKPKREKTPLRKSKLYPILLMRLESKLTIWLVSRRLRKLLLKQSREYYQSEKVVADLGKKSRGKGYRIVN